MGYAHIVAARNRLAELHAHLGKHLPQHLFGGGLGELADAVSSPEAGAAIGALTGTGVVGGALAGSALQDPSRPFQGITDAVHGATKGLKNNFNPNMPTNTFNPNMPTNTFNPNMPTNNFHASDPRINEVNYSPAINSLMNQGPSINDGANAAGQSGLAGALVNRGGTAYGQQQNLIGQLQNEAAGQGPGSSLAQALMKQQTENNIKQGAGLIASTKGLNPALAARMAADQSASMNQNAAAQGAQLGFQQQLAARQQLGNTLGGQESLYTGTGAGLLNTGRGQDIESGLGIGGLQNNRLGTLVSGNTGQNATMTTGQLGSTGINAGVAAGNQQVGAHGEDIRAGVAAGNQRFGAEGEVLRGGVASQNANLGAEGEQIRGGIAGQNAAGNRQMVGGLLNAGGGLGAAALSHGGQIPGYADGGNVIDLDTPDMPAPITGSYAKGGQVDHQALSLAQALMAMGGPVPGKSLFPGDNKKNDIVPTVLSPGEIVLPRTVAQSPDAPAKAASFVEAVRAKAHPTYGKVLQARRIHEQSLAAFHATGGWV